MENEVVLVSQILHWGGGGNYTTCAPQGCSRAILWESSLRTKVDLPLYNNIW